MEFNRHVKQGVFSFVRSSDAILFRIYGTCFMDEIKNVGRPSAYKMSCFVIQAYNDSNRGLLSHAPKVQRVSPRLLLALCSMDKDLQFFSRDDLKAYVQSGLPSSALYSYDLLLLSTFQPTFCFASNDHCTAHLKLDFTGTELITTTTATIYLSLLPRTTYTSCTHIMVFPLVPIHQESPEILRVSKLTILPAPATHLSLTANPLSQADSTISARSS